MIPDVIRRFFTAAAAVPPAVAGVRKLSGVVEARRGPSRGTRLLRQGADILHGLLGRQQKRGPFARRR